jgi:hypothetical protein
MNKTPDVLSFHAEAWWANQSPATQMAIVAVAFGLSVLLMGIGLGVWRRWRRINRA